MSPRFGPGLTRVTRHEEAPELLPEHLLLVSHQQMVEAFLSGTTLPSHFSTASGVEIPAVNRIAAMSAPAITITGWRSERTSS
jgi:hydroxymethylglutaryl-CoA reductase